MPDEMACLRCGAPARSLLCDADEASLAATVTAEQVRAFVAQPVAALVGRAGIAVPLGGSTTLGRDPAACEVALLAASVSARHARIARTGDTWVIEDLGSTNGTWVDDRPVTGQVALAPGARVRFADVELYFHPAAVAVAPPRRRRRTTLPGITAETPALAVDLTRRERRLVAILAARRRAVLDPEMAYVSSLEIAQVLGFNSIDADGDNVRELVLRVRRKLRAAGACAAIESRRGAGYRLAGDLAVLPAAA